MDAGEETQQGRMLYKGTSEDEESPERSRVVHSGESTQAQSSPLWGGGCSPVPGPSPPPKAPRATLNDSIAV